MRTLFAVAVAAVCFLGLASTVQAADAKPVCICTDCQCAPGVCPGGCTVLGFNFVLADNPFAAPCPNGKCPAQAGARVVTRSSASSSASCSTSVGRRMGPVRQVVANVRARRGR